MDAERIARLYRQYGPVIYSRCRRLLRDETAAADATQETFVRVMKHLDKAPPEAMGWIYRIATNHCLNQLRDRPVTVELPENLAAGSPENLLADRDQAARLLAALPEDLRDIAWLSYVDGLEQAEVAAALGISRRTVVNRLAELKRRAARLGGRA
jgi:RNA polymerase sigma-70 factor (ECF subfamily)